MADPVAHTLEQLCDHILNGFIPPATTILAVRRLNGCMAILAAKHRIVVSDSGLVYSAPDATGPQVIEDPEPA